MMRFAFTLCFFILISYLSIAQINLNYSFGGGLLSISPEKFSYINQVPDRPPYEVIPPRQNLLFFPGSISFLLDVQRFNANQQSIGISLSGNIAAFLSTSGSNNFIATQIPLLINYNIGERAGRGFGNGHTWGAFLGLGGSFNSISGDGLSGKNSFLPITELGVSKQIGRKIFELSFNSTLSPGRKKLDYGILFDDHFRLNELGIRSFSIILRISRAAQIEKL